MISVVIPAAQAARDLAGLLPALVPAVVSGLVREAILVDPAPDGAMLAICEDSGAGLAPDLAAAARLVATDALAQAVPAALLAELHP